jgi:hypothetical protein
MPGTNNFKVFNENFLNAQSDGDYLTETQRVDGLSNGMARTTMHNKMFRQWSVMVTALANFIAAQEQNASDIDLAALTQAITDAIKAAAPSASSTVDDTVVATGNTAAVSTLLSNVANMLKGITGKSSWRTAPDKSMVGMAADITAAQNSVKASGSVTYSQTINGTTTVRKTIAMGAAYQQGVVLLRSATSKQESCAMVFPSTDHTKSKVFAARSGNYMKTYLQGDGGFITNEDYSPTASGNVSGYVRIVECWFDGSNLVIDFYNRDASSCSMNCMVDWEVS